MRVMRRLVLLALCGLTLGAAAPPTPKRPPRSAPEYSRATELDRRLLAVVGKSPDVWGVSVRHMERHEVAGIREGERFLMASVFKVPILVELFHQVAEGKISLDERIEVKHPEIYFGSGVLRDLRPGISPTIHDLATLMIEVSDNMATDLLLERIGKGKVTARMRALGLSQTSVDATTREHTLESFGLRGERYKDFGPADVAKFDFDRNEAEIVRNQRLALKECHNCSTPSEMSRLLEMLASGRLADKAATSDMMGILSRQQFNQRLPRDLPVGLRFPHKTGTVMNPVVVVNDAGVLFLPNGDHVVITVFSKGTGINLDEAELKKTMNDAEDIAAEIGQTVFEFYTTAR
jgi:beta-lactamase class A